MTTLFITLRKWFLLGVLFLASFCFLYFRLYDYLTFETLKTYQSIAETWTSNHYQSAVFLYLLLFSLLIACAIPCATIFTLLGGFLFGSIAIVYATLGTTLGGTILFLAVRSSIGAHIAIKSSGWIKTVEAGFQQNAFHYLLMLRLVPVFPCWMSNISAGVLNVPLKTFLSATIIGIFPSTLIYALVGRGLDTLLDKPPNLNLIFTPAIFFPLIGLAILSIVPVFYKKLKK